MKPRWKQFKKESWVFKFKLFFITALFIIIRLQAILGIVGSKNADKKNIINVLFTYMCARYQQFDLNYSSWAILLSSWDKASSNRLINSIYLNPFHYLLWKYIKKKSVRSIFFTLKSINWRKKNVFQYWHWEVLIYSEKLLRSRMENSQETEFNKWGRQRSNIIVRNWIEVHMIKN